MSARDAVACRRNRDHVRRGTGVVSRRHGRGDERRRRRALPRRTRTRNDRACRATCAVARTAPPWRPTARSSSLRTAASTTRSCPCPCPTHAGVRPGHARLAARASRWARRISRATTDLHGPNDLAVATDGDVYFTDPGHYPPPDNCIGRVMIYERDRRGARRSPTASSIATASCSNPTATWLSSSAGACSACFPTDQRNG